MSGVFGGKDSREQKLKGNWGVSVHGLLSGVNEVSKH